MALTKLFCLCEGWSAARAFPVDISPSETVGDLKKLISPILGLKPQDFPHLAIFRVSVAIDAEFEALDLKGLKPLSPLRRIGEVFPDSAEECVRVLVRTLPLPSGEEKGDEIIASSLKRKAVLGGGSPTRKHLRLSLLPKSGEVYEANSDQKRNRPTFPGHAHFHAFMGKPGAIIVDKTHFIPLLESETFQYMFLRPRRWGKSTFLDMLATYYDIMMEDQFDEVFGNLYIGANPTKSRNSHLVLLFDFSRIAPGESYEAAQQAIFGEVSMSLLSFLGKYQKLLGISSPEEYIFPGRISGSLRNVLDLIYRRGYTAFVGVDEYDAPANTFLMDALNNAGPDLAKKISWLGNILKPEFFATIKAHCGRAVEKYWLTGVLPAFRDGISPLTSTEVISLDSKYQSLCGFTQENVNAIVARALPKSTGSTGSTESAESIEGTESTEFTDEQKRTLHSLKAWYNGYRFSRSSSGSQVPALYNPQLVFVHLKAVMSGSTKMPHLEEANAIHSATVLSAIVGSKTITVQDFVDMLSVRDMRGHVATELSYLEIMQKERWETVTWSLLYYLGMVTFHEDLERLIVPNYCMKLLITQRIRAHLSNDPGFSSEMHGTYTSFRNGNCAPFIKFLETFSQQRPVRSLAAINEANLETQIEFLWHKEAQCVPQMHLVVDPEKPKGGGRSAFIDLIVCGPPQDNSAENRVLILELKNVPLLSLWKARQSSHMATPGSDNEYKPIVEQLKRATEGELLDQECAYYDKEKKQWGNLRIKDIMLAAGKQLCGYMEIVSAPGSWTRAGAFDHRVSCKNGGDVLRGYVVICVGGMRVMCKFMGEVTTPCSYQVIHP